MMSREAAIRDLVMANRILANEGIVDAYGHVSIRDPENPNRYVLSRSRSPEQIERSDILEFNLDGSPVDPEGGHPYLERFLHGAVYEKRDDVNCVIHAHTEAVLPFTITSEPLKPVIHTASDMGLEVPLWDVRDQFGLATEQHVSDMERGRDLARSLDRNRVVLMRGHGFVSTGSSLLMTVRMTIYFAMNARVLFAARSLGNPIPLTSGEIETRSGFDADSPAMRRSWDYWAARTGYIQP